MSEISAVKVREVAIVKQPAELIAERPRRFEEAVAEGIERMADRFGLPTPRELDRLHRRLRLLEQRIAVLTRELESEESSNL